MRLDVLLTPADVSPGKIADRVVVVFDVLRATTTMTAALAAGVGEIRIFDSIDAARSAAQQTVGAILCGERNCLAPPGFDLGNSPGVFKPSAHGGKTLFMATTNGTRAVLAGAQGKQALIGALVNAAAVAQRLGSLAPDVTLLCAGTDGQPAMEDLLGAGAVIDALWAQTELELENDSARMAQRLFRACRADLPAALADSAGGKNVSAAGLAADIDLASRLDSIPIVGQVRPSPLRVVP